VINKLLNQYRFTYTRTTKQTNLTSFYIRCQQVNYFNTCKKYLGGSGQILKFRGCTVNRHAFGSYFSQTVNGLAHHIEKAAFDLFTRRHSNGCSQVGYLHSSLKTVC